MFRIFAVSMESKAFSVEIRTAHANKLACPATNLGGVSRDHMLSVRDGFNKGINPKLLAHPANCRLMIHNENISKNKKSILTENELLIRIEEWDKKYDGD